MYMGCPDLSRLPFSDLMVVLEVSAHCVMVRPVFFDEFTFFIPSEHESVITSFECVAKHITKLATVNWEQSRGCDPQVQGIT